MTTITIKVNERSKAGKAFLAMSESFLRDVDGIEIIETSSTQEMDSPNKHYSPAFVEMVLDETKSKKRTRISAKNLWQSI